MTEELLAVRDLKKHFPVTKGIIFMKEIGAIKAVDGVNFTVNRGETFGLVGESGCGKTTTAKLILLMERITGGTIHYKGRDISLLRGSELKSHRGSVQAVFQDPFSSLSPRMRVKDIIAEPIVVSVNAPSKTAVKEKIAELLQLVGLRKDAGDLYPHEFSGGQRQRIAIARALAPDPDLIVLDEPVSGLDVSIRAQIMNLLRDIQDRLGISYLLIAHDLPVVQHMSTWVGVMYLGTLVEIAGSEELNENPVHPYTKALLSAALPHHPAHIREEIILPGEVPTPFNPPEACKFHPRCFRARDICSSVPPLFRDIGGGHFVACHFIDDLRKI
ncbi:MAG: ATP-binding cassette domain-containing protein [Syntrophales bacterium]|jgi:oligopeptide/dipeptide ABC transporter ATP-binding protein|nr:ATP-binding cassette domain-containing protein [Syntrophales bacterium]